MIQTTQADPIDQTNLTARTDLTVLIVLIAQTALTDLPDQTTTHGPQIAQTTIRDHQTDQTMTPALHTDRTMMNDLAAQVASPARPTTLIIPIIDLEMVTQLALFRFHT